jgi:MFS family permease
MISDFYPQHERNVGYGIYYLAIPLGGALGFGIGALLGSAFGWRVAFFGCGIPGIFVAIAVLRICNPSRGVNDPLPENSVRSPLLSAESKVTHELNDGVRNNNHNSTQQQSHHENELTNYQQFSIFMADMMEILKNPHFMLSTLGQAANNFALGGLADWYATYMLRYCSVSLDTAGIVVGAATVIGGIFGTVLGSKVADYYKTRVKSSYFLIPAIFTVPATAFIMLGINFPQSLALNLVFIFVGELFVWTNIAPINSITITSIPPRLRSRASGLCIFLQHMLGDVISPPIIGAISDSTGSLKTGIQVTWMAIAVSGVCWWVGYAFCSPLDISLEGDDMEALIAGPDGINDGMESNAVALPAPTYSQLLCGDDVLVEDEIGNIVLRETKAPLRKNDISSSSPIHDKDTAIFS